MKKQKRLHRFLALLLVGLLTLGLVIPVTASAAEEETGTVLTTGVSTEIEVDLTDATAFEFSDEGITATNGAYTGYKIEGTALSIKDAGVYVLSGSCEKGSVVVKKNVTGVTLVLDGLTLSASATAAITCNKGSEVLIYAAEGSVNILSDDEYNNDDIYTDENLYPDIENAVIKGKDGSNVTIAGPGTIRVTANGKNGVKGGADWYEEDADGNVTDNLLSEASLTICEVTLEITATVNDGLKADKELNILSGNITVSAADDGIKSDYVLNIGEEGTDGPTIVITKAVEGIEAATLNVYSGDVTVHASDDGINAANSDLTGYSFSYNQYGGKVYVDVTNGDGIDSNGTILLEGGILEVYSPAMGDGDPLDSEGGTTFAGATVLAVGHLGMPQGYQASTPYVVFGNGRAGFGGMGGFNGGFPGQNGQGGFPGQNSTGTTLVKAGETIEITDASGKVLYKATAVRDASYILFASADLKSGETYTLKTGSGETTATAGTESTGGFPGQGGNGGFPGGQGGPGQGGNGGFPGGPNGQNGQGGPEGFPNQGGFPNQNPGQNPGVQGQTSWFQSFCRSILEWVRSLIDAAMGQSGT